MSDTEYQTLFYTVKYRKEQAMNTVRRLPMAEKVTVDPAIRQK